MAENRSYDFNALEFPLDLKRGDPDSKSKCRAIVAVSSTWPVDRCDTDRHSVDVWVDIWPAFRIQRGAENGTMGRVATACLGLVCSVDAVWPSCPSFKTA